MVDSCTWLGQGPDMDSTWLAHGLHMCGGAARGRLLAQPLWIAGDIAESAAALGRRNRDALGRLLDIDRTCAACGERSRTAGAGYLSRSPPRARRCKGRSGAGWRQALRGLRAPRASPGLARWADVRAFAWGRMGQLDACSHYISSYDWDRDAGAAGKQPKRDTVWTHSLAAWRRGGSAVAVHILCT